MTAEERGQAMMHIPMRDLPPLALAYGENLARRVGMCSEVLLSAWTTYAQLEENLPCGDPLYVTPADERERFRKIKAELSSA
jgi:hypothetical protein